MKRTGFLYEKICTDETIRLAIQMAAKRKRSRHDVQRVCADIDRHVQIIKRILTEQSFCPAPYQISQRYDSHSKKTRMIQRPKFFPDQVIHWAAILTLQPLFMRGMYHWSCGSIPGRGGTYGGKAIKRWLKNDRKNTKYCLKLDIRHFYDTIPHDRLKKAIRQKIKDKRALWLVDQIIDSTPQGVPIGNYTSQWFANFYLEGMDHFIKEQLGATYYVRYIDDIVIFGRNKKKLHALRKQLFQYIENTLGLTVKGNWQVFPVRARGVDFLGYVFWHTHTKLRARNFLALTRQCGRVKKKLYRREKIPYRMAAGLLSRAAQLRHFDSQHIKHRYYDTIKENGLKDVVRLESQRKLLTAPV